MRADLTKVRQALFNLLSNAAKFTERGTISLTVRREPGAVAPISFQQANYGNGPDSRVPGGSWLRFSVRDSGIGMTEDQISRLFQAFSQAELPPHGTMAVPAWGSHQPPLLPAHGRRHRSGSQIGQGSTFTVRLPVVGR